MVWRHGENKDSKHGTLLNELHSRTAQNAYKYNAFGTLTYKVGIIIMYMHLLESAKWIMASRISAVAKPLPATTQQQATRMSEYIASTLIVRCIL